MEAATYSTPAYSYALSGLMGLGGDPQAYAVGLLSYAPFRGWGLVGLFVFTRALRLGGQGTHKGCPAEVLGCSHASLRSESLIPNP
jgi:hypothetical protein